MMTVRTPPSAPLRRRTRPESSSGARHADDGIAPVNAELLLGGLSHAASVISTVTLEQKIIWLRHHRPEDQLQRMQSEAIVELYDVVKQIQRAMSTMPVIPGASAAQAAREAAARAASEKASAIAAAKASVGILGPLRRE
jgi:hypothetical protein